MQVVNRGIQAAQQVEALLGDPSFDHSPIVGLALPSDETGLFQAVQQPGHVRVVGDHALADIAAGQTARFSTPKNAKNIVLDAGNTELFEDLLGLQS